MTFESQDYILMKNADMTGWDTHKKDQMASSGCTGFALTNSMEATIFRLTGLNIELSAFANYQQSRAMFGQGDQDSGSYLQMALEVAKNGAVLESAWHSTDMTMVNVPPSAEALASAKGIKITSYERLNLSTESTGARDALIYSAIKAGYFVMWEGNVNQKFMYENRPLADQMWNNPELDTIHQYDFYGRHAISMPKVLNNQNVAENQWIFSNEQIWGDHGYGIVNSTSTMDKAYIITGMEINGKQYDMHYTAERVAVAELYIALFNRAPEVDGGYFWANQIKQGASVESVANAMACTEPALLIYPSSASSTQLIQTFYHNVLGRSADIGGLNFWVEKLQHSTFGQVVSEAIDVVMKYNGTDSAGIESQKLFQNKLALATYEAIMCANDDVQIATDTIHNITSDSASVTAAEIALVGILHHPVMA